MKQHLLKFEKDMAILAASHNLEFKKCTDFHFHLKGLYLINVYPTRNTFYVQGTNGKSSYRDLMELVELAKGQCEDNLVGIEKGVRKYGKSRGKRRSMWDQGDRTCFVCKKDFSSFEETTLEHKIPLTKGGSNRRDNLALSHNDCNQSRGNGIGI